MYWLPPFARGLARRQGFTTLPESPKYLELDRTLGARTKHPSRLDSFRYPVPDAVKMTHPIQPPGRRRPDISFHPSVDSLFFVTFAF